MVKLHFVWFLCFLACNSALPPPKGPFARWPSLITSTPRCPSVPALKDLKQQIQNLTKVQPEYKPELLTKLGEENLKCNDNIVELEADEEEEEAGNVNEDEKVAEENTTEVNEITTEVNNAASKIEVIPTFIPIFRPKIMPNDKSNDNDTKIEDTDSKNVNGNKNIIFQYVKNGGQKLTVTVIKALDTNINSETKSRNDDTPNNLQTEENFINGSANVYYPANVFSNKNTTSVTPIIASNSPKSASNKNTDVIKDKNPSFTVTLSNNPMNAEVFDRPSTPTHLYTLIENTPSAKSSSVSLPFNVSPTISSTSNIPCNNQVTPSNVPCNNQMCTSSISSIPNSNQIITPNLPYTNQLTSSLSCPNKIITYNVPCTNKISTSRVQYPNQIQTSSVPIANEVTTNQFTGQNVNNLECKCENKGDLLLFKPETVLLMDVEGDILKKVTMTVLVPMSIAKLNR